MQPPVALIIFNRPPHTRRVLNEIRKYKPSRLLVIADGPRSEGEATQCEAARSVIREVDWDCEVLTNYSSVNLGCRVRPATGLTWVFEQCEEAIILEDDCVPDPSFFPFCAELLEKYRADERIMMISGNQFVVEDRPAKHSYYFSRYTHTWGWASWRRAWQHYDIGIRRWSDLRQTEWLPQTLGDSDLARYWRAILDDVWSGRITTWDYQWAFACWLNDGLAVAPSTNLVSNIGFGEGATHTALADHPFANMASGALTFPLQHPPCVTCNREMDALVVAQEFRANIYRRPQCKLYFDMMRAARQSMYNLHTRWNDLMSAS